LKRLLILIPFLILSSLSIAQTTLFQCYGIKRGVWNNETQKYELDKAMATVTFDVVRIDTTSFVFFNGVENSYLLGKHIQDFNANNREITEWDAVDEDEVNCSIRVMKILDTGHVQLWACYADIVEVYFLNPVKND
jgi:hypothetical protein